MQQTKDSTVVYCVTQRKKTNKNKVHSDVLDHQYKILNSRSRLHKHMNFKFVTNFKIWALRGKNKSKFQSFDAILFKIMSIAFGSNCFPCTGGLNKKHKKILKKEI